VDDDSITGGPPSQPGLGMWGALRLIEEIGHGGFGRVYRAWDSVLAREVALKIIRPPEPNDKVLSAVLREGQLLARVRHANVVTIHGAQQIGEEVGLWMEFVRGRTLAAIVKQDGPRAANEAAIVGISLCQALAAVHQAGVIHRDVKAHNVMRESGGRIVLMDFGAGQLLKETIGPDESPIGTPVYMAPELLAGASASAASDVYSVGVLLYYLVTGAYPVAGSTWTALLRAHTWRERRPLSDLRPDLSPGFVRVVERATALDVRERYATPGAVLRDLTEVTTATPAARPVRTRTGARRGSKPPPPKKLTRTQRALLIALAIAAGAWVLGMVTSITFNNTLGRTRELANESVLSWLAWGFRAILSGAVYSTMALLGVFFVRSVWKVVQKPVPATARLSAAASNRMSTYQQRLGLDDLDTLAQAFLALQVIALVVFCWWFRDIFAAIASFVETAAPEALEPLRPEHFERRQNYNLAISLMILAMGAGVIALGRRFRASDKNRPVASIPASRGTVWRFGSLAAIAVAFVLLAAPYRLFWHNEVEVALFDSRRCYVLGESDAEVRLFCPTLDVPRTRLIARTSPQLEMTGIVESLYTRPHQ
jgi:serine/threonine-protein kinase